MKINIKVKRTTISIILTLVLFAAVFSALFSGLTISALAVSHTSKNLNIFTDQVVNVNGYALLCELDDGYLYISDSSLIDSTGKIVQTFPYNLSFDGITNDGYYLLYDTLYNSKFNQILEFDPYSIICDSQSTLAGEYTGMYAETLANAGVIAIVDEIIVFIDYSGNITGTYSGSNYENYGYYANIGTDSLITIGDPNWDSDNYYWVVVDKTGKVIIDLGEKYSNIGTFCEGMMCAFEPVGYDEYMGYYIDKTGKTLISIDNPYMMYDFSGGYATVAIETQGGVKYGVIDKSGNWVIAPQYEDVFGSRGIFAASKGGKFGYVDAKNNVLVPFEYDDLSIYDCDVGYGVKNGKLYAIVIDFAGVSDDTDITDSEEIPLGSDAQENIFADSTDIPSDWAIVEVSAAIKAGLVPEELQRNYSGVVTRSEVMRMFINLIEKASGQPIDDFLDAKGVSIKYNTFTDTTDKDVLAANALGIILGVGDNKFDPDGNLQRAQIAAIINRVARIFDVDTEGYGHDFTDVTGHWVDSELGWPVHTEIIKGVGGHRFDPRGTLTTEQAIAITYRALNALLSGASS